MSAEHWFDHWLSIESPGEWEADAACKEHPALFALPATTGTRRERYGRAVERQIDAAVAVCAGCLVFDECLRWATTTPDPAAFMVAAGMTPTERVDFRRARGITHTHRSSTERTRDTPCTCVVTTLPADAASTPTRSTSSTPVRVGA